LSHPPGKLFVMRQISNVCLVFVFVFVCLSPQHDANAVELVSDGKPNALIVHQGDAAPGEVLQHYVKAMTGAKLKLTANAPERPDMPTVELELVDQVQGSSDRPTAQQAYRLYTDDNVLRLQASSERGLLYAAYGLLEDHCGIRFFSPDCELIPHRRSLTLPELNETCEPAFQVRSTFMSLNKSDPWEIRNRGGGLPQDILVSSHGFYDWLPPSKYLVDHPKWYPLINGKRQDHWLHGLCYSNPDVARQLAKNIMERIRSRNLPAGIPIRVGQGDGFVKCECDTCRTVASEQVSEAGPVILMLNRVLEEMAANYPDHPLITFAYAGTLQPPANLVPHPNLWINVVSSGSGGSGYGPMSGGDMLGPIRHNSHNAAYAAALKNWPKVAPGRVSVWHWASGFNDPTVEWPNLFTTADNIRLWRQWNVSAVALQTTGGNGNWGWLKHWVWLKLLWNPDADVEALTREFLGGYYGSQAAPYLWQYQQLIEQVRQDTGYSANACSSAANGFELNKHMFRPDVLAQMDALLSRAADAARGSKNPIHTERIRHAQATSVDQLKLIEAAGIATHPGGFFYPPERVKLHRVQDPRDGSDWLVPGSTTDIPARVERIDKSRKITGAHDAAAAYVFRFWFQRGVGGKLVRMHSNSIALEVCPNLLGTITSLVHRPTGKQLLSGRFPLIEWHSGMQSMEWFLPEIQPGRLVMEQWIQTDSWFYMKDKQRFYRTLTLDENAPILQIRRHFEGKLLANEPGMPANTSFPSTWQLLVPAPGKASLRVNVGNRATEIQLSASDKTEIQIAKPPELVMSNPAQQSVEADPLFDEIIQEDEAEEVEVVLHRGDGLVIQMKTPAKGWLKLIVQPVPNENRLVLTFHGESIRMSRAKHKLELPDISLQVIEK